MTARLRAAAALTLALSLAATTAAQAGGMVLPTRGVRPTARGGAFVAGADDLGALAFNPAGLAHLAQDRDEGDKIIKHKRSHLLIDAAFVKQSVNYARIDSGNNALAAVDSTSPGLAIPTIAYARAISSRLVIGGGIYAPYAGLTKFAADGPARYSSIDLSKSLLVVAALGVGVRVSDRIRLGATLENMIFMLSSSVIFAGCPGETVCAPEDPEFDALTQVTMNDYVSPSGSVGAQVDLHKLVTLGLSFHGPFNIGGQGKVQTRLPTSGFYNGASVEGDRADVAFTLPASFRAGLEVHPGRWKFEAAVDVELWKEHDEMDITPKGVRIVNSAGVGTYVLSPVIIPRHYKNTVAGSFGVEGRPVPHLPLRVMAGYTYETAAAPDAYLSTLTVDGQKQALALGGGYAFGRWQLDAMVSFFKMKDRTVTPAAGLAPQLSPIRDTSADPLNVYVNWGTYKASWLAAGLGVTTAW
jgi:long-chain fatty acid transport protein